MDVVLLTVEERSSCEIVIVMVMLRACWERLTDFVCDNVVEFVSVTDRTVSVDVRVGYDETDVVGDAGDLVKE